MENNRNEQNEAKHILLINDLPGYGKVALAAMNPLLSGMGYYTIQLPTALVSNTLDYGKFQIQDTTEYMAETLKVWQQLGIDPDCICTGFLLSVHQAKLISEYIESRPKNKERLILVDPIMGDGGHLYNGVTEEQVQAMKHLISYSDVMVPNLTEASYLTGIEPGKEERTKKELRLLIDRLHEISGKSVVITSAANQETNTHMVCGYDHKIDQYFQVSYEEIPVRVPGSGDIFSAVLVGRLLKGLPLEESVTVAVTALARLISEAKDHLSEFKGIQVEQYRNVLEEAGVFL